MNPWQHRDIFLPVAVSLAVHPYTNWHEETNPWQCEECAYMLGSLAQFLTESVHGVDNVDRARTLLVATNYLLLNISI